MLGGRVALDAPDGRSDWIFVVGRAFLAAVPSDAGDQVVEALAAVGPESSVDLESMVALLPQSGPAALGSFALAVPVVQDAAISVLVRGDLAVDVHTDAGSRRFGAGGVVPWLLADFRAVSGLAIGGADRSPAPLAAAAHVVQGSGRGGRLTWLLPSAAEPGGGGHPDDTVLVGASTARSDTLVGWNTAEADTVILSSLPARQRTVDEPMDAAEPTEPGEATGRYGFRLDGAWYPLDGSYYLGRQPQAPRIRAASPPTLLAVPSPTRAVSSTHLEIRQDGDAVVVTDLGSTNGTVLVPPAGTGERLRHGASRAVVPGTRVDIGDGNIVEILPVSSDPSSSSPASNRKAHP